jgi:hypothetical protein
MEVSESIFCARESVRGRQSMASTVTLRAASCCKSSGFCAGQMKLISVVPGFIRAISSAVGARTLKTRSEPAHSSAALPAMVAPAD